MKQLNLIVEIGTEEIPAGYLGPALDAFKERLGKALADQNLEQSRIETWGTPNRMAIGVWGIPEGQPDVETEATGPPKSAAYDSDGNPTKAALGFAKGQGVDVADLLTITTKKGEYLGVRKLVKGKNAAEVLSDLLPGLILGLPFPKSMRWGTGEVTFVRPIHWILSVLDGSVLPLVIGEIKASDISFGHRFLSPEPIQISSPDEYEEKLANAGVIASIAKRRATLVSEIEKVVAEAGDGLSAIPDDELVTEVANLVESPVGVCGQFDASYLKLPEPVLITAMREHQRYFAVKDADNNLTSNFVAASNTRARDMDLVKRGHERVLKARLDDARFHFNEDRKNKLESRLEGLKKVVYQTKLGTSFEKVTRTKALAGFIADCMAPELKDHLLRAADLAKCDLITGLVGEFPSLQGTMGMIYARLDGEEPEVADAIFDHYLPSKAGGMLPQTPTGTLLSLAEKIETITGCFGVGLIPTGAADPYALRRQALGVINIVLDRGFRFSLVSFIDQALEGLGPRLTKDKDETRAAVMEFFKLRLKNLLTTRGASTDSAEAVLSLHSNDIVTAAGRVWALEDIKSRPDFDDLAAAFKRVVNIIKKFGASEGFDAGLLKEDAEKQLFRAFESAEARAKDLAKADDWAGLLNQIVSLKTDVDRFFDEVLVDDEDPAIKNNRLALLTNISRLFALVADFSKIST